MKRIIAIALLVVLALSLVACGGPQPIDPATAIVGKWKNDEGATMEFKADGTGSCYLGSAGYRDCTWKYNAESGVFEINYSTSTHNATVAQSESGSLVLTFQNVNYKKVG